LGRFDFKTRHRVRHQERDLEEVKKVQEEEATGKGTREKLELL